MATSNTTTVETMAAVPTHLRGRIVSGMRWTLWLSVLAAPFGYATSVLLARTGPEVIGTYGLLMVYIGVVSCLFYLGGDTVVMKFVPELAPEKRLAFLTSYFLVVLGALAPWLAAATLWPGKLHYLLGERAGPPFLLLILYLSPIYLIFSVVVAALKAMLDMRWAQTLLRVLTLGSFLLYAILFLAFRALLKSHFTGLIWGIYLGLTALATFLGLGRLLRQPGWPCPWRTLRFFLPRGFWSYTLSLEQQSAVNFFSGRLDLILVLNFGGLKLMGSYVAIVVLGDVIRVAGRAFLDTLLPSLTNLLARRNLLAASQVLSLNLRILFLVYMAATCGLMFLAGPITGVLGARYVSLRVPFLLMALFLGLSAPGTLGGVLLSAVGKQQRAVWIALGQVGLFTTLFLSLWPRWQLMGAVLATGISLLLSNLALLGVAKWSVPFRFSVVGDYTKFVLVGSVAALVAMRSLPFGLAGDLLAWACAMGAFLVLARYRFDELRQLVRYFLPGRFGAGASGTIQESGGENSPPWKGGDQGVVEQHAGSHHPLAPPSEEGSHFRRMLAGVRVRLRHQGLPGLLSDVVRSFSTLYEVWQCDLTSAAPTLPPSATVQMRVGPDAARELERARQMNTPLPLAFYRDLADGAGGCAFLAVMDGEIAGIAWGYDQNRPMSSLRIGPGDVEVCDVYTLDQFRGRGVAKALLSEACRCYRERGFRRAYATIRDDNTPSLRAFQSVGFRKVGKVSGRKVFGPRFDAVAKPAPRRCV